MITQRTLYLVGLATWVTYVIFFPTWTRRSYNEDVGRGGAFHEGGMFGLRGADGFTRRAPLWDPPQPSSDAIDAAIRWPGQPVAQSAHIELALANIAARLSLGILVLGLLLGAWTRLSPRSQPDRFASVAWSLSLALVIAWICILAVGAFTAGYGLTDEVMITILTIGVVGGFVYGFIASRHHPPSAPACQGPARGVPPACGRAAVVSIPGRQPSRAGAGLLWFTVGMVSALCLMVAAGWIASFFRGPVIGVSELGTPRYARDQTPVNMFTGLGLLAAGWTTGLLTLRLGPSRALSVGLILGTALLAIAFALRH